MIVARGIVRTKPGRDTEALELCKAEVKRLLPNRTIRWYQTNVGPSNTVSYEVEVGSLADWEKAFAEFSSRMSPEFNKKWLEVVESEGTLEIWTLV
jgi:hypothetical protein